MSVTTLNVMNMPFTIVLEQPCSSTLVGETIKRIHSLLVNADTRFSPFRDDSLLSRFQSGDSTVNTDPDFQDIYLRSLLAKSETHGLFDPYYRGIYDPTGLTKGWIVQHIFDTVLQPLLNAQLISGAALNAGGDMVVSSQAGTKGWMVGIENPYNTHTTIASFELNGGAVATSGNAKRGDHIKRSYTDVVQATVIADSLIDADVWATALYCASFEEIAKLIEENTLTAFLVTGPDQFRWFAHGVQHEAIATLSTH